MRSVGQWLVVFGIASVATAAVWLLVVIRNPLRRPAEQIEARLLAEIPLGTTFADVIDALRADGLHAAAPANVGFMRDDGAVRTMVGVRSIRVLLGEYIQPPFFTTSVTAFFGFDETGRLIAVWVWKTTDAP